LRNFPFCPPGNCASLSPPFFLPGVFLASGANPLVRRVFFFLFRAGGPSFPARSPSVSLAVQSPVLLFFSLTSMFFPFLFDEPFKLSRASPYTFPFFIFFFFSPPRLFSHFFLTFSLSCLFCLFPPNTSEERDWTLLHFSLLFRPTCGFPPGSSEHFVAFSLTSPPRGPFFLRMKLQKQKDLPRNCLFSRFSSFKR